MATKVGSRKNREKGSAAPSVVGWLPLFLTLVMGVSVVSFALVTRTKAHRICFEGMVQLQRNLRDKLVELEKLNPRAKSLRTQRTVAEAKLKAALASGQPPLIAAAQAHRLYVIAMQLQLQRQQQTLLQQARKLRLEARQNTDQDLARIGGKVTGPSSTVAFSLAVRPAPPLDLSPDYVKLPNFKSVQAENLSYRIPLFKGVPQWTLKNIPVPKEQTDQCGATLNPDDWSLALSVAKP